METKTRPFDPQISQLWLEWTGAQKQELPHCACVSGCQNVICEDDQATNTIIQPGIDLISWSEHVRLLVEPLCRLVVLIHDSFPLIRGAGCQMSNEKICKFIVHVILHPHKLLMISPPPFFTIRLPKQGYTVVSLRGCYQGLLLSKHHYHIPLHVQFYLRFLHGLHGQLQWNIRPHHLYF